MSAETTVETTATSDEPMPLAKPDRAEPPVVRERTGFLDLLTPSYLLCFALLGAMVAAAGVWEVLADSRVLAALLAGGIVALGEDDAGLGTGVPGVHYFIRSQEPITWSLLLLSAVLFAAVAALKGVQFHKIARFVGIDGSLSEHVRAYIYGHGLERMLPYRIGEVAWASALESQGKATLAQAARLVFIFKGFLLFEIASFALIGLFMSGLLAWGIALVPPLTILLLSWLLMRPPARERAQRKSVRSRTSAAIGDLLADPQMLVGLVLLSLLSFSLVEFATYIVPQAFATPTVPLVQDALRVVVVTPPVIVMAVVAGYIARLVPVTPGGIGQFELAFALVLMANDLPLPEAVTLALLVSGVRYVTGAVLFGATMLWFGIETDFGRVRALFGAPQTRAGER